MSGLRAGACIRPSAACVQASCPADLRVLFRLHQTSLTANTPDKLLPQSLEMLLNAASARYSRPPTPLCSQLIHGGVLLLWLCLFLMAFRFNSALARSTGLVYLAYDSLLLVFVFMFRQTLRLTKTFDASMRPQAVACDGNSHQIPGAMAAASQAPARSLTLDVIVAAHN